MLNDLNPPDAPINCAAMEQPMIAESDGAMIDICLPMKSNS